MSNNEVSIVAIADIHLGVLDVVETWENIKSEFISYCIENKPDLIVIAGDILDEKVAVNSTTAAIFHMFIESLLELNSTLVVVEGTKSHDDNQINIFSAKTNDKFKIYKKATSDYICGMKVLLLPEEYMTDPVEYYKEFLNKKYDFCFGHGMFNHISYSGESKRTSFKKITATIWDYIKHFKNIIHGRVVFGHIHTHNRLDKFYYTGSFGRYRHGEEEPKGFMHFIYDKSKKKVIKEKFIENKYAKIFKTIKESDLPSNRDAMMVELKKLAESSFKLRIQIDRDIIQERRSDIIGFCKNYLNVSIDYYFERKRKSKSTEEIDISSIKIENKYENMDIVDATVDFILDKHGVKFDRDIILKTINSGEVYE